MYETGKMLKKKFKGNSHPLLQFYILPFGQGICRNSIEIIMCWGWLYRSALWRSAGLLCSAALSCNLALSVVQCSTPDNAAPKRTASVLLQPELHCTILHNSTTTDTTEYCTRKCHPRESCTVAVFHQNATPECCSTIRKAALQLLQSTKLHHRTLIEYCTRECCAMEYRTRECDSWDALRVLHQEVLHLSASCIAP